MPQITKKVRDAVRTRLADPVGGFNAHLAAVAPTYGVQAFTIDWTAASKRFFQGFLNPDDVDQSAVSNYPLVMLYGLSSGNENRQKFSLFSGTVALGLDFHLTWRAGNALRNFEDLCDAVEDAVYRTFNDPAWAASYGAPLAYNGEIVLSRRPIELAGEHWRQTILFRLTFQVDTD